MDWNLFWTAVGAIGGTLGAFATTIAVIVALWQTKFSQKKRLKLSFTDNITIVPENGSFYKQYIGVTVTNIGNRDVVIHNWGFNIDNENSMMIVQDTSAIGRMIQEKLPHRLIIEESITLYYEKKLFINVLKDLLKTNRLSENKQITFYVTDSTGKKHYIKTEKVVSKLIENSKADKNTEPILL